jgi:ubiquinone/menaquinone biosynthesis C-methylase UbiE
MDFRKIFDTIPEEFDKWRPRYCQEAFDNIITDAKLDKTKKVLEIGPGTGQATEPVLKSGCDYLGIELGNNLADFMKKKFSSYKNFNIVNADYENYDFEDNCFDLIYSAATIQWIPEKIGFPKTYKILKSGGTFVMMFIKGEYKSSNECLYNNIQKIYNEYFIPEYKYTCRLDYKNVLNYGFIDLKYKEYKMEREFTADEYVAMIHTHCDHITLQEPNKSKFYDGIRNCIMDAGNKIILNDTIVVYSVIKP